MAITNPTGSKNLSDISSLQNDNGSILGWVGNRITNIKRNISKIDSNDLTYTIYIGIAAEGTLESSNTWNIKRVIDTPNSNKDIKTAVGSWNSRTALIYS